MMSAMSRRSMMPGPCRARFPDLARRSFARLLLLLLLILPHTMAATLSADERFDLITRRLQEHLGDDIIKAILAEDGRTPKCYWGP
jgi:hypothetical protein